MPNKYQLFSLKLFLYLIPIGIVTGPFIPDLCVTLIVLIFIYLSFTNNLWRNYFNNRITIFFLLFNLYLIIISLTSDNIFLSLKSSLFYFRFFIFSLAVWYILDNTQNLFKRNYSIYLFLLLLLISLDAMFQYKQGYNILGYKPVEIDRISSFFNDRMVLGGFVVRMLALTISLFLTYSLINKKKIYSFILYNLLVITIILSGERTALGLFFILLFLWVLTHRDRINFLLIILIPAIIIIIITSVDRKVQYRLFIEPLHQSNLISESFLEKYYSNQKKGYVNETKNLIIFSKEHTQHYKTAFKIFLSNPITGIGPKMYRIKCSEKKFNSGDESCSTHPHNIVLQLLAETGLIGLLFYIVMLYFIISRIIKYWLSSLNIKRENFIEIACLITFVLNLFPFLPSGNIFNNWLSILFYFPLGFYLYQNRIEK